MLGTAVVLAMDLRPEHTLTGSQVNRSCQE